MLRHKPYQPSFSMPRKKPSFYVYFIQTPEGYVGPYGKREWAKKVMHKGKGHKIVRRKRGSDPNTTKKKYEGKKKRKK